MLHVKRAKQFRPQGAMTRQEQKAKAERWRGSAYQRGYDSRWNKARRTFLQANPLCIGCLAVGRTEPATVVDHVDPHHGDPDKFWDTSMWQACCKWHHDSVKQSLEAAYARGRLRLEDLHLASPAAIACTRGLLCT